MAGPMTTEARYRVGPLLGRGGMAEVNRGTDTRLDRQVAIKRLRPELAMNPVFRARFRREAAAAAKLNHPGIVAVLDSGELQTGNLSIPFIVMELIDGTTLRDILCIDGTVAPERALAMTAAILDALAASHAAGVIHRDIKPANVMLTKSGQIKVADFGIARAASDDAATLTLTATVMGTAQYMSPEQVRGEPVDPRSDLYSVGCLLYELIVGCPPFNGSNAISIAYQHVSETPVAPADRNPTIPTGIDRIVMKALAKAPADRYQTAERMKADIDGVLSGRRTTGSAAASTADSRKTMGSSASDHIALTASPRARRHRHALLAMVILLMLGIAGYGYDRFSASQLAAASEVPAVLGFSRTQAESVLRNAQLVPRVHLVNGPATAINTVIRQTPSAGQHVAARTVVTVEVDIGPQQASIPRGLVGRSVEQVRDLLIEAGFSNVTTQASSSTANVATGTVTALYPPAGERIATSERIIVTYVGGRQTKLTRPPARSSNSTSTSGASSSTTDTSQGTVEQRKAPESVGKNPKQSEKVGSSKKAKESKKAKRSKKAKTSKVDQPDKPKKAA